MRMTKQQIIRFFGSKIAHGIIPAICVSAVVVGVVNSYQNGNIFHPEASEEEMQGNQILFPDSEEFNESDSSHSDDSDTWEQDYEAEDKLKPEDIPDSSVLFEREMQGNQNPGQSQVVAENGQAQEAAGGNNGGNIYVPGDGDGDVVIPGGDFSNGGEDNNGNTGGNGGTGGNGNSGGQDPGTIQGSQVNDTEDERKEPGSSADLFFPVEEYPETGLTEDELAMAIFTVFPAAADANQIYYGQKLDEEIISCAVEAYLYVGDPFDPFNMTAYRIMNLAKNPNFKIGEFPETATEDFTVTFQWRSNPESNWQAEDVTFSVHRNRIVLKDWSENGYARILYPDAGETAVDLRSVYDAMFEEQYRPETGWYPEPGEPLKELFLGWAETPDGEPLPDIYEAAEVGRVVLYPVKMQELPEGYEVYLEYESDYYNPRWHQVLRGYSGNIETLLIPKGIHKIELEEAVHAKSVIIPSSVETISGSLEAETEYSVDEDNTYYSSLDGMLFDKEQTVLMAVPLDKKKVILPSAVTEINLIAGWNAFEEMHIQTVTPPEFDGISQCVDVVFYVPDEQYETYLLEWGNLLGEGCEIRPENGESTKKVDAYGALLSFDGKVLYRAPVNAEGIYFVPDGVETIAEGAFEGRTGIEKIVLPESIQRLETKSLTGSGATEILCGAATPPTIAADTFDAEKSVIVQIASSEYYITYRTNWDDVLGVEATKNLLQGYYAFKEKEGFEYLRQTDLSGGEDSCTLLRAPATIQNFDQNSVDGVTWKAIANGAFEDCTSLITVELPENVKKIGKDAFRGCTAMEGFLSCSGDTIEIGENAFEACSELRYLAFNAMNASFENGYDPYITDNVVCQPAGAEGYEHIWACKSWGVGYFTEDQGDGKVLYGDAYDSNGEATPGYVYLIRGTSGVSGEIKPVHNGQEMLIAEILSYALAGCPKNFSMNSEAMYDLQGIGSFAFATSGLSGVFELPEAVQEIEEYAFSGCTNLTGFVIPEYSWLYQIDAGVFAGCTGLTELRIPDTIWGGIRLGTSVFPETLQKLVICCASPPDLDAGYSYYGFSFGFDEMKKGIIELQGAAAGKEMEYAEAWSYQLDSSWFPTDDTRLEALNKALYLMGIDSLDQLPGSEAEEQNSEDEEIPDVEPDKVEEEPGEEGSQADEIQEEEP